MRTREDIEAYLSRSGHPHKEVAEDTWLVSDPSDARDSIVVRVTDGLVLFRMKVLEVAKVAEANRAHLYESLLRFNAEDMVHGAYGIVNGDLVIVATLRLENLDFNEFSGTLDDFSMALTKHHPQLRELIAEGA
jgi:hypothetical protein